MPAASDRSRRRRLTSSVVGAAIVVLLAGGLAVFSAVTATGDAGRRLDASLSEATEALADARASFAELRVTRDAARGTFEDSTGSVLDETAREALAAALDESDRREVDARIELTAATELIDRARDADRSIVGLGVPLDQAADALDEQRIAGLEAFAEAVDALDGPVAAVGAAVAAWNAEQERILRERYTEHVWAAGWIPELDACRGSVDLTARYGIPAIAEHWSCGGKDFPDEPGTIITLTGLHAGTYRVEGVVKILDQHTTTTADLPRGYELVYQTCQGGQSSSMSLTALTRIDG